MALKMQEWMSKVHPVLDRVCLVEYEGSRTTEGGLHLPDAMSEGSNRTKMGVVFAVGPGKRREDGSLDRPHLTVGQIVNFVHAHQFQEVNWQGHKFYVVDENDTQVVLDE